MGNVFEFLFKPVGLGGMGVDFTKKKTNAAPAPTYDENAEKEKAAQKANTSNKRRYLEQTDTVKTSALGATGNVTTGKKTLLGG